jgi:hypothetical protein
MDYHDRRPNHLISDELHPIIYIAIVGLGLWFVLSAWVGFATDTYTAYLLVVVSGLVLVAVAIPCAIWLASRKGPGPDTTDPSTQRVPRLGIRRFQHIVGSAQSVSRRGSDSLADCGRRVRHDGVCHRGALDRARDHLTSALDEHFSWPVFDACGYALERVAELTGSYAVAGFVTVALFGWPTCAYGAGDRSWPLL